VAMQGEGSTLGEHMRENVSRRGKARAEDDARLGLRARFRGQACRDDTSARGEGSWRGEGSRRREARARGEAKARGEVKPRGEAKARGRAEARGDARARCDACRSVEKMQGAVRACDAGRSEKGPEARRDLRQGEGSR
jgi:hypothetical protein